MIHNFHLYLKVRIDHKFDGLSRMEMEFILGLPPQTAYDVLTNQDNESYSRENYHGRPLLVCFFFNLSLYNSNGYI